MNLKRGGALAVVGLLGALLGAAVVVAGPGKGNPDARAALMRGGGHLTEDGARYTFTLHCDPMSGRNRLQVKWAGNRFRLERLQEVVCTDDPAIDSSPPPGSGVDTYEGAGEGRLNRDSGALAQWTFRDAGEPGSDDFAAILVKDADGQTVLSVCGTIAGGNNQGFGQAPAPASPIPDEDPVNVINIVEIEEDGTSCLNRTATIPEDNIRVDPVDPKPEEPDPEDDIALPPEPVINPMLVDQLEELGPFERVEVLVQLQEDLTIPRLPDLPDGVERDSELGETIGAEQQLIVDDLLEKRTASQMDFLQSFDEVCRDGGDQIILFSQVVDDVVDEQPDDVCEVEVREHYWLVNAFLAEISLGALDVFEQMGSVASVDPRFGGEIPPNHDGNPNNDVDDGRGLIVSDPYFNLSSMTGGYIGLLDTGVRSTHTLFGSPNDNLAFLRDCVNGGPSCNDTSASGFNTNDDCWNHGTSTAAVIMGNANLGGAFRGITDIQLDSWKVYPTSFASGGGCNGFLDSAAVVRGFQRGLLVFDRVFVAEMQSGQGQSGSIATAADNAFDAGAVVIAANGNNGPGTGTVNSPALAHRVIGIGDFDVQSLNTIGSQSRGPAPDSRYKPDVQAPTNTETASASSNTALRTFTGTSGATPYGAGAAALLRNWLRKFNTFDPGQVYVQLIEAGQNPWPYSNTEGAGDLQLITCATAHWGKVPIVSTGSTIDIPINVGPGKNGFEAAIWWPEGVSETHDDIDLSIIDPFGLTRDFGLSAVSVFERVRVAGALATGTWKVRIRGFSVPSGPQTVYWVADVRGC